MSHEKNNIVMAPGRAGAVDPDPGHPAVFKDDNPACPPEAQAVFVAGTPLASAQIRAASTKGVMPFTFRSVIKNTLAHCAESKQL